MSETTVVLGWDGLDYDLVEAFGLANSFGPYCSRLETFDNPVLGKPHTNELWPSILTGVDPETHGVHAAGIAGTEWRSSLVTAASRVGAVFLPDSIRTRLSKVGRNRGLQLDSKDATYYCDRGISTVFDGYRSRSIAIPNYRVPADDELAIVFDRGAQLSAYLTVNVVNGKDKHSPKVPLSRLEERLAGEVSQKLGIVRATIQRDYDLVFVWLGYLDTVGHLAPAVVDEDPGWQERAYQMAAAWTDEIATNLLTDDTLVVVSDHGLRDGDHTHDAFIGSTDERAVENVDTVLDVREVLERVTSTSQSEETESPLRGPHRSKSTGSPRFRTAGDVRQQLETLGYL